MSAAFRLTGETLTKREQDFHQALVNRDLDSIELLLAEGANINQAMNNNYTALRLAIALCQNERTKRFLAAGADPKQADKGGNTPLHTAATYKNLTATQMLLEAGATPRVRNLHGLSPLHILLRKKEDAIFTTEIRIAMMEALLKAGANPDDPYDADKTDMGQLSSNLFMPLFYAARKGEFEIVTTLLKFGANQKRYGAYNQTTCLHVAAENGHVEVVRALLENAGTDMEIIDAETDYGSTPLLNAFKRGNPHPEIIRLLLAAGAEINIEDEGFHTPMNFSQTPEIFKIMTEEIESRRRWSPMRVAWMSAVCGAIKTREAQTAVAKLSSNYAGTLLLEDAKPDHTLG